MKDISIVVTVGKWGGVFFYKGEGFVTFVFGFISLSLWGLDVIEFIYDLISKTTAPHGDRV